MVDRILHTAGTRSAEVASRLGDLGRNVRSWKAMQDFFNETFAK
jgi:hypothetical protein